MLGLLSEGLGVEEGRLKEMTCLEGRTMVAHYYPYCPRPDLTYGLTSHTDPGVVTVLVQNEVGGLQVKVGEEWVDVEPVEGAVVINIGDILQVCPFPNRTWCFVVCNLVKFQGYGLFALCDLSI